MDLKFTTCSMFLIQTGICAIFAPFLCPLRKDLFKSLSYISFYPSHPSATVFPQPNIFRLFRFSPLLAKYFPFQNIFLLFHFSPHFPSLNIFLPFLLIDKKYFASPNIFLLFHLRRPNSYLPSFPSPFFFLIQDQNWKPLDLRIIIKDQFADLSKSFCLGSWVFANLHLYIHPNPAQPIANSYHNQYWNSWLLSCRLPATQTQTRHNLTL